MEPFLPLYPEVAKSFREPVGGSELLVVVVVALVVVALVALVAAMALSDSGFAGFAELVLVLAQAAALAIVIRAIFLNVVGANLAETAVSAAHKVLLRRFLLFRSFLLILVTARDHACCKQDGTKSDSFSQHCKLSG
jgi:uncharacterized membrane protein YozB (DUF420 family)